jgi:threonine synthase
MRDIQNGKIPEGSTIVCTLTGHGLKDPDIAIKQSTPVQAVDATLEEVKKAIMANMGE